MRRRLATDVGINPLTSSTPSPTVTGINIDFASANGGETRIITGTNLTSATVTVDSNSATVTANTSTSVNFTVPASSVSATDGNGSVSIVTVTTAGGSAHTTGIPGNSLWYVPAYYGNVNAAVYTAQDVTTMSGDIVSVIDQSGNGYDATPISGAPTYFSTGGGNGGTLPYWYNTNSGLTNTIYPTQSPTVEWVIAARYTGSPADDGLYLCDLGSGNESVVYSDGTNFTQYSFGGATNPVLLPTDGADFNICSLFDASGQQILDGETPVAGGNSAVTSIGGLSLGGYYAGGYQWIGNYYFAAIYPAALTVQGRANYSDYFSNQGLPPAAPPTVTSIFPPFGTTAGGTAVTITGTNFQSGGGLTNITIDGYAITTLVIVSDTQATGVTASSGSSANADVVVTGPGGSATLSQGYTYMPAVGWTLALYGENGIVLNTGNVSQWNDQSGAGNNFTQSTFANQPAFNANGLGSNRGAITFGPTSVNLTSTTTLGGLLSAGGSANGGFNVYAVCYPTSATTGSPEVWDTLLGDAGGYFELAVTNNYGGNGQSMLLDTYNINNGGDFIAYTGGGVTYTASLLAVGFYDTVNNNIQINSGGTYTGTVSQPTNAWNYNAEILQIGTDSSGNHTFKGQVAAIFAWDSPLSSGDDIVVRTFFKNYYGITNW